MTLPYFGLSPAQLALQEEARRFALERIRPRCRAIEWRGDPRERVPWDLVEEASARGWRTLAVPSENARLHVDALTLCVFIEELAYGDMGFAVILDQTLKITRILLRMASNVQIRGFLDRFLPDQRCVLAICFTEEAVGSDYVIPRPGFRFGTNARREGDRWILTGRKRFISNGADAGFYLVFACTDPDAPAESGTSAFLVPAGMPGVRVVQIHEKIAQRTINNAEIAFEEVSLAENALLGKPHYGYAGAREVLKESALEAAATTLGTARAAYDEAVAHAKQRVQGGRPLIEHANIACRLADMAALVEASHSLIWRAAWAVEHQRPYDYRLGSLTKVFVADAAVQICLSALEIFGGLGIMMQEAPVEKYLRDCLSFLHSDGAQDSHRLRVGRMIADALD